MVQNEFSTPFQQAGEPQPNSEKIIPDTFGALFLALKKDSYGWQFANTEGQALDSGQASCR